MSTNAWTTAITRIEPNRVCVRGYDIAGLMGRISFGQAVYLLLKGDLPDKRTGRLMEAILVSSIDHGATPPSALAARTVASTGASLSAAVGAGLMSVNEHHGGAIQACAAALGEVVARAHAGATLEDAASAVIADYKNAGRRIAGFGHRIHTADPRTARLFELAADAGLDADDKAPTHIQAAKSIERAFTKAGKSLPINVDGAIGAILADLGFDPAVMNGVFMIARAPGLVAHVAEEKSRERPMRKIDPVNHTYDGPDTRHVD